jgi:hypothetical protein
MIGDTTTAVLSFNNAKGFKMENEWRQVGNRIISEKKYQQELMFEQLAAVSGQCWLITLPSTVLVFFISFNLIDGDLGVRVICSLILSGVVALFLMPLLVFGTIWLVYELIDGSTSSVFGYLSNVIEQIACTFHKC